MQLIVLSAHRSGSSACTRLLNMAGAYLGASEDLKAPNPENRKGFWENDEVVDLNKLALQGLGGRWDRVSMVSGEGSDWVAVDPLRRSAEKLVFRLDAQRPWATKDPRMCLLLPFWRPLLECPNYIFVHRHPLEIAHSLHRRGGIPLEAGLAMWEKHMVEALRESAGAPRVLIRYKQLMEAPVETLARLLEELSAQGVTGLHMPSEREITAFIDPALYRERLDDSELALLNDSQRTLHEAFERGDAFTIEPPAMSAQGHAALEAWEASREPSPEPLLANSHWNLAEVLRVREELNQTRKQVAALTRENGDLTTGKQEELKKAALNLEKARAERFKLDKLLQEHKEDLNLTKQDLQHVLRTTGMMRKEVEWLHAGRVWRLLMRARAMASALGLVSADAVSPTTRVFQVHDELIQWNKQRLERRRVARGEGGGPAGQPLATAQHLSAQRVDFEQLARWLETLDGHLDIMLGWGWWRLGKRLGPLSRPLMGAAGGSPSPQEKAERAMARWHKAAAASSKRQQSASTRREIAALEAEQREALAAVSALLAVARSVARNPWYWLGVRLRLLAILLGAKVTYRYMLVDEVASLETAIKNWKPRLQSVSAAGGHSEAGASAALTPTRSREELLASLATRTGVFYDSVHALLENNGNPQVHEQFDASEQRTAEWAAAQPSGTAQPLVSVIMPTHNRAGIIAGAITSVREQIWENWELLVCDDGSTDDTQAVVRGFNDDRIRHLALEHGGAARARNAGLAEARGEYIAYLDSDNFWHPAYLLVMVGRLVEKTGHYAAYAKYLDVVIRQGRAMRLKAYHPREFCYESLCEKNFIDLNTLVHRASLYHQFGGFTDSLPRLQDWDLIQKYAFLRDPLYVDAFLAFYRRNEAWNQLTKTKNHLSDEARATVERNRASWLTEGLPANAPAPAGFTVAVISWDICRNHFSKAYNVAEALHRSGEYAVHLIGFRFFDEPIFPPYEGEEPPFQTTYLDGSEFPDWNEAMARAVLEAGKADLIYCVKPRLPSLGTALLANYHFGTPVVLESNDHEAVVARPGHGDAEDTLQLAEVDASDPELRNPYCEQWSRIIDACAKELPFIVTHNKNLDAHYGGRAFYIRNLKDETHFDPALYDRDAIRAELGFSPDDRVILFGGLLRKHKGIYQIVELVEALGGAPYRALFVGSRVSPDQERLVREHGDKVTVLPPQGRNEMASINHASDAVILWLDPAIRASHYQMPYKLTDALAMEVPVIANDISDLGDLGRQGYLRLVDYGDWDGLQDAVRDLCTPSDERRRMVEAGRRLYLRQFCYRAAQANFRVIREEAMRAPGLLPVAEDFAAFFSNFQESMRAESREPVA